MNRRFPMVAAGALAFALALGACGQQPAEQQQALASPADMSQRTLASALAGAPGMTAASDALVESGLAAVLDGPGSYTVLVPDDDAFAKLGSAGTALSEPGNRAMLVAVLRGHILPGHVTPEAITQAIAARKGPVTMRTLAGGSVTFAADGQNLLVTGADGAKARLSGAAIVASNGVAIPIDALVRAPAPPAVD